MNNVMEKTVLAGISFDNGKNKWVVRPSFNGERTYLGAYESIEVAIEILNKHNATNDPIRKRKHTKPTQRLIKAFEWLRKHGSHLPTDQAALEYIKQMTL